MVRLNNLNNVTDEMNVESTAKKSNVGKNLKRAGGAILLATTVMLSAGCDNNDNDSYIPSAEEAPDNGVSDVLDVEDSVEYQPVDEDNNQGQEENNAPAENEVPVNAINLELLGGLANIDTESVQGAAAVPFAIEWHTRNNTMSDEFQNHLVNSHSHDDGVETFTVVSNQTSGDRLQNRVNIHIYPDDRIEIGREEIQF